VIQNGLSGTGASWPAAKDQVRLLPFLFFISVVDVDLFPFPPSRSLPTSPTSSLAKPTSAPVASSTTSTAASIPSRRSGRTPSATASPAMESPRRSSRSLRTLRRLRLLFVRSIRMRPSSRTSLFPYFSSRTVFLTFPFHVAQHRSWHRLPSRRHPPDGPRPHHRKPNPLLLLRLETRPSPLLHANPLKPVQRRSQELRNDVQEGGQDWESHVL
jgi:hypothetical protein